MLPPGRTLKYKTCLGVFYAQEKHEEKQAGACE